MTDSNQWTTDQAGNPVKWNAPPYRPAEGSSGALCLRIEGDPAHLSRDEQIKRINEYYAIVKAGK